MSNSQKDHPCTKSSLTTLNCYPQLALAATALKFTQKDDSGISTKKDDSETGGCHPQLCQHDVVSTCDNPQLSLPPFYSPTLLAPYPSSPQHTVTLGWRNLSLRHHLKLSFAHGGCLSSKDPPIPTYPNFYPIQCLPYPLYMT
jgi:hypothetical protein